MPLMRRRPLLRAAAVGGSAYVAGKRRARSQEREAGQEQRISELEEQSRSQPAPATSTGISPEALAQLKQLGELHDQGVLTDEEFAQQKQRLLAGS
jgi:Short C-terminal domain